MDGDAMLFKVAEEARATATAEREPFRFLTGAELLQTDFPPREMCLAPWLPTKGIAMCYGPRGIGKTHLTLGVAYAIATGGTFLRWNAPRPRRVLVIDGEMPAVVLQERLGAIVRASDLDPPSAEHLRFLAMDQNERSLDLSDEDHRRELEPHLAEADVLIVDNLSTLTLGGKENEGESWVPVQGWALSQRRKNRSVLFVHHAGKGGAQRGTSRREDVLDTVIALRLPSDHEPDQGARFEVHFEKSRGFMGDEAKPFDAALSEGLWTCRDLTDVNMAQVVVMTLQGMKVREIAEDTGMSKSAVNRLQAKARETGKLPPGKPND